MDGNYIEERWRRRERIDRVDWRGDRRRHETGAADAVDEADEADAADAADVFAQTLETGRKETVAEKKQLQNTKRHLSEMRKAPKDHFDPIGTKILMSRQQSKR